MLNYYVGTFNIYIYVESIKHIDSCFYSLKTEISCHLKAGNKMRCGALYLRTSIWITEAEE